MASPQPLVIVGGGLAGSLAALCLAQRRPEVPVLLLEADETFGGNHTWSFFDSDVPPAARDLIAALDPVRWPRHKVSFPERRRTFDMAYSAVEAPALDSLVRTRLAPGACRTGTQVEALLPDAVILAGGERIAARGVIDARGPAGAASGLTLGWQKFVGIEFAAASPEPDCATVMDATVVQLDGYRFVYVLPLGPARVLVEDTYYSDTPALDEEAVAGRVRALAAERGLLGDELRRERGVLPILLGGDPERFWPASDPIPRLGLRGGFFQPTTGYSLGLALQTALDLADQPGPLDTAALARWSRGRFLAHWQRGRFYRMINRMMFHAGRPDQRWRVLQHFYRLPPDLIARFYAGELTTRDKLRVLSGRPPVPVGQALTALLKRGEPA